MYSSRKVLIESTPLNLTGGKLRDYDTMTGTIKLRDPSVMYEWEVTTDRLILPALPFSSVSGLWSLEEEMHQFDFLTDVVM